VTAWFSCAKQQADPVGGVFGDATGAANCFEEQVDASTAAVVSNKSKRQKRVLVPQRLLRFCCSRRTRPREEASTRIWGGAKVLLEFEV
jgi:hypothetical protein